MLAAQACAAGLPEHFRMRVQPGLNARRMGGDNTVYNQECPAFQHKREPAAELGGLPAVARRTDRPAALQPDAGQAQAVEDPG